MPRKRREESPAPGCPAWLATYGDMITNVLVFFVLLFSFSTVDAQKWKALVGALSGNVGVLDGGISLSHLPLQDASSISGQENSENENETEDDFEKLFEKIKSYAKENNLETKIEISKNKMEILMRFKDSVLFDSGKADLKSEAIIILGDIALALDIYQKDIEMIRIEGHTDNVPINTSLFPSNWELSTARAVRVLRFFIEQKGLSPIKLSAVGYGEYHPIVENTISENRLKNRRVDIVIARTVINENESLPGR